MSSIFHQIFELFRDLVIAHVPLPNVGNMIDTIGVRNTFHELCTLNDNLFNHRQHPVCYTARNSDPNRICNCCLDHIIPGDSFSCFFMCHHFFHSHCVEKWLETGSKPTCPNCREHSLLMYRVRENKLLYFYLHDTVTNMDQIVSDEDIVELMLRDTIYPSFEFNVQTHLVSSLRRTTIARDRVEPAEEKQEEEKEEKKEEEIAPTLPVVDPPSLYACDCFYCRRIRARNLAFQNEMTLVRTRPLESPIEVVRRVRQRTSNNVLVIDLSEEPN